MSSYAPREPQVFRCGCEQGCKGISKPISRAQYYRHAKYRQPGLSQTLQTFVGASSSASVTATGSTKRGIEPGASTGAADKRTRLEQHHGRLQTDEPQSDSAHDLEHQAEPPAAELQQSPSSQINPPPHPGLASLPTLHLGSDRDAAPSTPPQELAAPLLEDHENHDNILAANDLDTHVDEEPDILEYTAETHPSRIDDIRLTQEFIDALKRASLDDDNFDPADLERLRHPPQEPLNIADPDLRLSLDIFLAVSNASEQTYHTVRAALLRYDPECGILSYHDIKRQVAELSGVVPLLHHMCINTCIAYTGPFRDLETCPICHEPRYEQLKPHLKIPRQEFHTIPIGPQLQALWRTTEGATSARYRARCTEQILKELSQSHGVMDSWDDIYHGKDYLDAVQDGKIGPNDMVLLFSIDGAQLYEKKASDCWIYIWILLDHSPDLRYKKKHIFPGGFIPGPSKPKNLDSFIFPGFHHLAALQNEGLSIWDAALNLIILSFLFLIFGTADTPAMSILSGTVGHTGAQGCRLYCPMRGRHKPGAPQYYPARLKPDDYDVVGCDHEDYSLRQIDQNYPSSEETEERYKKNLAYVSASRNQAEYKRRRLETGICKPSIFSGLPRNLGIPRCFPADLMHLVSLNLTELLIGLWRGTLDGHATDWEWATLKGATWQNHGKLIAAATPYLPGSFDRPPRNPAEKMSSGYKAWEFLMYIFGLAPALLYGVLPDKYWKNFCKLVYGIRIIQQRRITAVQLRSAHTMLVEFLEEYEIIYYQRKVSRIHFCRQSIHAVGHLVREVIRVGPAAYVTQWPMERMIGDLGSEIRQHSNPFTNLSQRGVRRAQVNALKAMIPDLDPDQKHLPRGAQDLGDGYVLLRAVDTCARSVRPCEGDAIKTYFRSIGGVIQDDTRLIKVTRWARLQLPNGQIGRAAWKEKLKPLEQVRMARNVKVEINGQLEFGEVQFYFKILVHNEERVLVLLSLYTRPDNTLLQMSSNTVYSCQHRGDEGLIVVEVKAITAVVAIIPHKICLPTAPDANEPIEERALEDRHFVVEKPGLDVAEMGGVVEEVEEDD